MNVTGVADLSVDVAILGSPDLHAIVISSGVHGVEGPFGAAVQLAWMDAQRGQPVNARFVLIHALNPYGYALGRRVNEDNIDLNRNFLGDGDGDGDGDGELIVADVQCNVPRNRDYARFDALLNPKAPPKRIDLFLIQALAYLAREGKQRLQSAIVTGQYEFAQGLFYGGDGPSVSVNIVQNNITRWIGGAPAVCHLDFHTGLGRFGQCQLLVQVLPDSTEYAWYCNTFSEYELVPTETNNTKAYQANGAMGNWLTQCFGDRPYRFLTAEFGTYSARKMLASLRAENQAFHHSPFDSEIRARERLRLERCFCPPSPRWRCAVVEKGLTLIQQATFNIV